MTSRPPKRLSARSDAGHHRASVSRRATDYTTSMHLAANVFDVWVFRRRPSGAEFLLLYTSTTKASRHFNGGRFWQIPSDGINEGETILAAMDRTLGRFGLRASAIWAGEHAYLIYNRRFDEMQAIGVFAAEVDGDVVNLEPEEHSDYAWLPFDVCLQRVHYRGLKDGLRSVHEYITSVERPARELRLWAQPVARAEPEHSAPLVVGDEDHAR